MNSRSVTAAAVAVALLAGCATTATSTPPAAAAPAPQMSRVYIHAQQGQDSQQQDRDRYECFNWAIAQTGFDPSRQALPREMREVVVPAYPAQQAELQRVSNPDRQNHGAASRYDRPAADFTRAMSACLEGRGYAVR